MGSQLPTKSRKQLRQATTPNEARDNPEKERMRRVRDLCGIDTTEVDEQPLCKGEETEERDEIQEVQKRARRETANVIRWRNVVTCALVCTAVAVVISTFLFLKREETKLFETAVSTATFRRSTLTFNEFSSINSAVAW